MRAVASGVLAAVLAALSPAARAQPAPSVPAPAPSVPAPGVPAPSVPAAAPASVAAEPASATAPTSAAAAAPGAAASGRGRHRGPWLLVGGSLALVTAGAVLAYSANAAERDVEDLYVGLNGTPPPFNSTTQRLYNNAVDEGHRYQTLSIASFSLAAALAAGAAVWFALDRHERLAITPAAAPGAAGVSTAIRF